MLGSILKSTSPSDLMSANENNLYDIYRFLAQKGGRTLVEEDDVSWVIAKPLRALPNPNYPKTSLNHIW